MLEALILVVLLAVGIAVFVTRRGRNQRKRIEERHRRRSANEEAWDRMMREREES